MSEECGSDDVKIPSSSLPFPRQQVELGTRRTEEEIPKDAFHNTRPNYQPRLKPQYYSDNAQ